MAVIERAQETEFYTIKKNGDGVWCYGDYGPMVILTDYLTLYGDRCDACRGNCTIRVYDHLAARAFDTPRVAAAHYSWYVAPATLYASCKRLGLERVDAAIKDISYKTGLGNKGAYLNKVLRSMI